MGVTEVGYRCSKCGEDKPLSEYHKNKTNANGHHATCKLCHIAVESARYEHNKGRMRDRARERTFGLDPGQYDKMLAEQGGVCAICGQAETSTYKGMVRALAVDHSHETGDNRLLLCAACNMGIGCLGDDPDRLLAAAAYLIQHEVLFAGA